jgi:hypothetical protein
MKELLASGNCRALQDKYGFIAVKFFGGNQRRRLSYPR